MPFPIIVSDLEIFHIFFNALLVRWDPKGNAKSPFFAQSCLLYASYYQLQILIHRPFIPSPRRPSTLSFPSLAICTNAARSCSHVVDVYNRRTGIPLMDLTVGHLMIFRCARLLITSNRCPLSQPGLYCCLIFGVGSVLALGWIQQRRWLMCISAWNT